MQGRSLRPFLEGKSLGDWRKSVYYAYYEDSWRMYQNLKPEMLSDTTYTKYFTAHRVGPHRGVRTDRFKLIEYYTEGDYWELFDLQTDTHELRNLYGEVGYEDITSELRMENPELRMMNRGTPLGIRRARLLGACVHRGSVCRPTFVLHS